MAHDVPSDPLAGLNIDVKACLEAFMAQQPSPEPDPRENGHKLLVAYCRENRVTQRQLAGLLGCVHSHAGRILRGENQMQVKHAVRFERATGIRAAVVLGLEPESSTTRTEGSMTDQIPPLGGFTA